MTTEIPVTFVLTTMFVTVVYWMVNLMPDAVNFVAHWLILELSTFTAQSIGMLISVLITSPAFKVSVNSSVMIGSLVVDRMDVLTSCEGLAHSRPIPTLGDVARPPRFYGDLSIARRWLLQHAHPGLVSMDEIPVVHLVHAQRTWQG